MIIIVIYKTLDIQMDVVDAGEFEDAAGSGVVAENKQVFILPFLRTFSPENRNHTASLFVNISNMNAELYRREQSPGGSYLKKRGF